MAPYDGDSSDDDDDVGTQLSYTETNVLLGYADAEDQASKADGDGDGDGDGGGNETVSRLGGRPDWLGRDGLAPSPPSAGLARCLICKALLVLLLQLNGELPDRFPGHERRLYVLACRNKACRRRAGSVRVIRGVRVEAAAATEAAVAAAEARASEKTAAEAAAQATAAGAAAAAATVAAPGLGSALFGGGANPFAAGGASNANPFSAAGAAAAKNPFTIGGGGGAPASAPAAPAPAAQKPQAQKTQPAAADAAKDLPKTFAETLSLNSDKASPEPRAAQGPAPPPEAWPPADTWPAAYPVSWIAEAEYETLDPTPTTVPGVSTESMEIDDGSGGGGGGKEDKFVYESSMDAAFQKFADRVAQNPDQVIRYEFSGQPLFYNKDDAVAGVWGGHCGGGSSITTVMASASGRLPPCPNCRSRRVFEVQLMPHAIDLLEASELGLDGMDWGTVLVAVCEKDCQARGTAPGEASYLEEWVGVQWEELQAAR